MDLPKKRRVPFNLRNHHNSMPAYQFSVSLKQIAFENSELLILINFCIGQITLIPSKCLPRILNQHELSTVFSQNSIGKLSLFSQISS